MKSASRLTSEDPETKRQAQSWEVTANLYEADGLCRGCAGQAAYGHQVGFSRIKEPCEACRPVVSGFPFSAGRHTPWRRFDRGDRR